MKRKAKLQTSKEFSAAIGRALRRAAKIARKTARMHGTPIYIWKNGKVVAEKRELACRSVSLSVVLRILNLGNFAYILESTNVEPERSGNRYVRDVCFCFYNSALRNFAS